MEYRRVPHLGWQAPAHPRALLAAAFGFALLWVCVVTVALGNGHDLLLLGLGATGAVLTIALVLMVREHHRHLEDLAATDALTGLANHRGFHELLAVELDRAARAGESVALVTLDLDNFKTANDLHGHPFGDDILRLTGARLRSVIRDHDIAARVGGEEFALILPGADKASAFEIAERAREAIRSIPARGLDISCSAGIASFPGDAADAASLYQMADSALYWAKSAGKRRTRSFDAEHAMPNWTLSQQAEIEAILRDPEPIRSVFQPIIALATGALVGYEALARFPRSADRAPDVVFAQAHGCGLGDALEAAAIEAALDPIARPAGTLLAINVSPSALASEAVRAALPADLTDIVIEITEHEFIPDDSRLMDAVEEMRRRGAKIAIDDAGAGYAGLRQLMGVRPDIVKLDSSLVHDIHTDEARIALAESFVRFARRIGATVCAEGIETLDELACLADLDVEWGQGYVITHPADPWAEPSPRAEHVCKAGQADALKNPAPAHGPVDDRRLEHLSAILAGARSREDLDSALGLIAAELNADVASLSRFHPEVGLVETLAENLRDNDQSRFLVADYPYTERALVRQVGVQVTASDPESDPAEVELMLSMGLRSLLMLPVVSNGESIGLVEVFRREERVWTRAEISRGRVIANQFASVIHHLSESTARSLS